MDGALRAAYNASFTEELFRKQVARLEGALETKAGFRLAETPVFLDADLAEELATTARRILKKLSDPAATARMKEAIPARWNAPGMDDFSSLTQIDLAIVRGPDGRLTPKLIELQGFPSLSAFETYQAAAWESVLVELPAFRAFSFLPYFSGLDRDSFKDLFRRTVVGDHDPENVILMDLDPEEQKTWIDFAATKKLLGVDPVCPTKLVRDGKRLYRLKDGRRVRVERIYNRVVFDELIKKDAALPFDFRDELEVEWVPHPNWYWTWSKYSLPMLDDPAIPKATFLSELSEIPADLTSRYVLKPLFSFAGGGVNVEPTKADVDAVPEADRHAWCLQEKIAYDPCIQAVDGGGVKVEIRMMFYKPDGAAEPTLGLNLCRLSRGKMLGVDFNKDFTWVGSSVALQAR